MNHTQKNKTQKVAAPLVGIPISLSKLRSNDMLEWLRFIYYSDKDGFIKAFDNLGITIDKANPEAELKTLANLHNTGKDMSGELTGPNGVLKFDIKRFVGGLQLNHKLVNNSNIRITI